MCCVVIVVIVVPVVVIVHFGNVGTDVFVVRIVVVLAVLML